MSIKDRWFKKESSKSEPLDRFLSCYESIANGDLDNSSFEDVFADTRDRVSDKYYQSLSETHRGGERNFASMDKIQKRFEQAEDRLGKMIALDSLAHEMHSVNPELTNFVFDKSGDEAIAKAQKMLDNLSGLDSSSDVRKVNRGYFTRALAPNEDIQVLRKSEDGKSMIIGGWASVPEIDREGHLITLGALRKAFAKFMKDPKFRNIMIAHSSTQVGEVLPEWKSPTTGKVYKSGIYDKGLYIVVKMRDDIEVAKKVAEEIKNGTLRSFSIAGTANPEQKHMKQKNGRTYWSIEDIELSEVTICEMPVNPDAHFEILKASDYEEETVHPQPASKEQTSNTPSIQEEIIKKLPVLELDRSSESADWIKAVRGPINR